MPYPGYLLNPGDMFQVEPERVLFATGESKSGLQAKEGRQIRRTTRKWNALRDERRAEKRAKIVASSSGDQSSSLPRRRQAFVPKSELEERKERRVQFQELINQARRYVENSKNNVGANKKKEIRAYVKDLKGALSRVNKADLKRLETDFASLTSQLSLLTDIKMPKPRSPQTEGTTVTRSHTEDYSPEEKEALRDAIVRIRENPVDDTKPYATPWRPRPFMSAFAFVPRYLEVNHNICSAVYLRHPVARPGMAEVPTPFPADTQQLAFNWYLRRR